VRSSACWVFAAAVPRPLLDALLHSVRPAGAEMRPKLAPLALLPLPAAALPRPPPRAAVLPSLLVRGRLPAAVPLPDALLLHALVPTRPPSAAPASLPRAVLPLLAAARRPFVTLALALVLLLLPAVVRPLPVPPVSAGSLPVLALVPSLPHALAPTLTPSRATAPCWRPAAVRACLPTVATSR